MARKKKPYIKKIGDFSGFHVWFVNGFWIRKHLDEEFTNFGQHYRFKFIPENEFWIDYKSGNLKETKYFIQNLLIQNRLMARGKSYDEASEIANRAERAERNKSRKLKKLKRTRKREILIKKVHKKLLKKFSNGIKIWIVKGDLVRSLFFIDFTEGGHDKVYKFIPEKEIWIDDDLYYKEIPLVIIHELHERWLMAKGKIYDEAHKKSNEIEHYCRVHPKSIKKRLLLEIRRNKKI